MIRAEDFEVSIRGDGYRLLSEFSNICSSMSRVFSDEIIVASVQLGLDIRKYEKMGEEMDEEYDEPTEDIDMNIDAYSFEMVKKMREFQGVRTVVLMDFENRID